MLLLSLGRRAARPASGGTLRGRRRSWITSSICGAAAAAAVPAILHCLLATAVMPLRGPPRPKANPAGCAPACREAGAVSYYRGSRHRALGRGKTPSDSTCFPLVERIARCRRLRPVLREANPQAKVR